MLQEIRDRFGDRFVKVSQILDGCGPRVAELCRKDDGSRDSALIKLGCALRNHTGTYCDGLTLERKKDGHTSQRLYRVIDASADVLDRIAADAQSELESNDRLDLRKLLREQRALTDRIEKAIQIALDAARSR